MFKEFREFAMRGNVIDMAVGIIIGAAFGKIVDSLVKDVSDKEPPIFPIGSSIEPVLRKKNAGDYIRCLGHPLGFVTPYAIAD